MEHFKSAIRFDPSRGLDRRGLAVHGPTVSRAGRGVRRGEDVAPSTGGSGEKQEWRSLIQPIVQTTLKFDTEGDMLLFLQLLDRLAVRYPMEVNVQSRLICFLDDLPVDK